MPDLVALGRLQSLNNMPLFLAVDADLGSQWTGDNLNPDDSESDADRASEAVLDSDSVLVLITDAFAPTCASVSIGAGNAIVMKVGSSGVLEVYRHGPRVLIVEGAYAEGGKVERPTTSGTPIVVPATAEYTQYVVGARGEDAVTVGSVDAKSGWILLLPTSSSGAAARELAAAAKSDAVTLQARAKDSGQLMGLLVKVPPGKYNLVMEPEVELDFGLVARAMIERA